ncbi:RAMP superfamily CRISPR-associated protein [Segatella maculosa]|uniref:RAMP superfamily CRISPR-associated protein n=1 Tax=Segatella maculosa TaxID=439703 RepID=UPI0028D7E546|nr:RAMP superfamily CRISPR-associated protein [Segatella maculosa]
MEQKYRFRQLARVVLELKTPLAIGSGNKNIKTDSVVAKDVNGLPYIPGTTLAGLIRHALPEGKVQRQMGWQEKEGGEGSRLIITEAKLLSADGTPIDGLSSRQDTITRLCRELPIRQHVRINSQGTAVEGGKFDEEIVPKGTRFCFECELLCEEKCDDLMDKVIAILQTNDFRIGSGSRSGFGQIAVIKVWRKLLDLRKPEELALYLQKSSSLTPLWSGFEEVPTQVLSSNSYIRYQLHLQPTDFMFFGSGFGDERSDMTFVREPMIEWNGNQAHILEREQVVLIPAASVKGALAHRTAYHYNKLEGFFADNQPIEELEDYGGKGKEAVKILFGSEGNSEGKDKHRGRILFSDFIKERKKSSEAKVLNHVKIDRFTGGAMDGALFSEEVLYASGESFDMELLLHKQEIKEGHVIPAFEAALIDLCKGFLPLGGGVNKGFGTFIGSLTKDGETIYAYDK